MDLDKRDCWQYTGCGREPGGVRADDRGVCPAAVEKRLDGVHGGTNGGRACWVVAGTLSSQDPACERAGKEDCLTCEFYRTVLDTESPHIVFTPAIRSLLVAGKGSGGWLDERP